MKETGNPATGCVLPESLSDSDYYSRNDSRDDSEKDEELPERKMKSCCLTDIANSGVVVNIPIGPRINSRPRVLLSSAI